MSVQLAEKKNEMELWIQKVERYSEKEKKANLIPKRGDIWTVDFGVTVGSEMEDVHPAVILSSSLVNEKSGTIFLAPISSMGGNPDTAFEFHIEVQPEILAWGRKELHGVIKTESPDTVSKGRLGKRIGRLNGRGLDLVTKKMGKVMHYYEPISPEEELLKRNSVRTFNKS